MDRLQQYYECINTKTIVNDSNIKNLNGKTDIHIFIQSSKQNLKVYILTQKTARLFNAKP